ncbi:MAG: hypothetical protein JWP74_2618 [Marmoricola sp.]|nr:hypothetical protein [Marmoricola sp.]
MDDLLHLHSDSVFLRRDALEHGYDDDDLRQGLAAGVLVRIRHGAYTSRPIWSVASEVERHRLRSHAVLRSHRSQLALSHTSAAVEHEMRMFRPDLARVHVTCLDRPLSRSTRDVVYHCPSSLDGIVDLGEGIRVVDPARAAVEAAAVGSVQQGIVVLDAALDLGCATPEALTARYLERSSWPHSRHLQISMRLAREGSNSVGESLIRHVMWETAIPEPVLQYEVRDRWGNLVGRTDFAWPEYGLLGEFDGMVKYGEFLRPGETPADALRREKGREDQLREETGWLMIRFIWDDIFKATQSAERIREQLRRGRRALR